MVEIGNIATNLQRHENGIWFSRNRSDVSYPDDGHSNCLAVESNSFWFKHRNRCIIQSMHSFPPVGTVFDIGAGNGYVSFGLKSAGIDIAVVEPGLQGAMNAHDRGLDPVVCSTVEDAGFNPHSIPAIGIFDVLEHIENETDFLETAKKLLIPNGRLYITVPAYNFLWSVDDDYAGHFRRYTVNSLALVLESLEFRIDFKTYIFSILPLPIFVFRTLPCKVALRTASKTNRKRKELTQNQFLFQKLLDWAFLCELRRLRNKMTIPFGGSCLVVARLF